MFDETNDKCKIQSSFSFFGSYRLLCRYEAVNLIVPSQETVAIDLQYLQSYTNETEMEPLIKDYHFALKKKFPNPTTHYKIMREHTHNLNIGNELRIPFFFGTVYS